MTDHVDRIQEQWRRARPDLDPSPQGVIGRVHRLARALTAELVSLYARYDLSEAEFDLLASLRRQGDPFALAAGDLASATMVTTGGLTKRVDRLVERGLVARSEEDADRRRRSIRLTPAGVALIDDAFAAHLANEQRLIDLISPAEAAALRDGSRAWLAALGED